MLLCLRLTVQNQTLKQFKPIRGWWQGSKRQFKSRECLFLVCYRSLAIALAKRHELCFLKRSRPVEMLRVCAVLVAGATALQAPRQPLSTAPSWLQAATLEQPPATSKDLLPRERYVSPGA